MIVFLSFSQAFNQIFMKDITLGRANYHADRVLYDIAEIANIKIYCHKKKKWAQGARLLLLSDDFVQYIDGELGSKKPPRFRSLFYTGFNSIFNC